MPVMVFLFLNNCKSYCLTTHNIFLVWVTISIEIVIEFYIAENTLLFDFYQKM